MLNGLGVRANVGCGDLDFGGRNGGELGYGQARHGHGAYDHGEDGDDHGDDRTVDEEFRQDGHLASVTSLRTGFGSTSMP